jgi:hypothetical protein
VRNPTGERCDSRRLGRAQARRLRTDSRKSSRVSRQRIRNTRELTFKIRQPYRLVSKRPVGEDPLDLLRWIVHSLYVLIFFLRRVSLSVSGSLSVTAVGVALLVMSAPGVPTDTFEDGTIVEMARLYTTRIAMPAIHTAN